MSTLTLPHPNFTKAPIGVLLTQQTSIYSTQSSIQSAPEGYKCSIMSNVLDKTKGL